MSQFWQKNEVLLKKNRKNLLEYPIQGKTALLI